MSNLQESIKARLSVQRALLGQITPNIRFIIFTLLGNKLDIKFYFDGLIQSEDYELASCVETEIMADYDEHEDINVECIRLDFPASPELNGVWVYKRHEG